MSSIKPASQLNADQTAIQRDVNTIKDVANAAGASPLTREQSNIVRQAEIDIVAHVPGAYSKGMDTDAFNSLVDAENGLYSAASGSGTDLTAQVGEFAKTANASFDNADGAGSGFISTADAQDVIAAVNNTKADVRSQIPDELMDANNRQATSTAEAAATTSASSAMDLLRRLG